LSVGTRNYTSILVFISILVYRILTKTNIPPTFDFRQNPSVG